LFLIRKGLANNSLAAIWPLGAEVYATTATREVASY
jgi:hypothetical protein